MVTFALKMLKDDFLGIPNMALTATLDDSQLVDLAENYLQRPVVIKGSVKKKNETQCTKCNFSQSRNSTRCGMRLLRK